MFKDLATTVKVQRALFGDYIESHKMQMKGILMNRCRLLHEYINE